MSATMAEIGPYLALILVGFLPNEVWRLLGLVLVRGLDEDSQIVVWVRAVATAMLAACWRSSSCRRRARSPPSRSSVRVGAAVLGFLAFLVGRRSVFAGVLAGELAIIAGAYWSSAPDLSPSAPPQASARGPTAPRASPFRSPAASSRRRPCAG